MKIRGTILAVFFFFSAFLGLSPTSGQAGPIQLGNQPNFPAQLNPNFGDLIQLPTRAFKSDEDDWYSVLYSEKLYVKVDEQTLEPITAELKRIRLEMEPAAEFHVEIFYVTSTAEYQLSIPDFDSQTHTLKFLQEDYDSGAEEVSIELKPGSLIRFRPAEMTATWIEGGSAVEQGPNGEEYETAWESIRLEELTDGTVVYDFLQTGDFHIIVQKDGNFEPPATPGPFTPTPTPTVSPSPTATPTPTPTPVGPNNPNGGNNPNNPPAPGGPNPSGSTPDNGDGMSLAGGGGLMSCSFTPGHSTSSAVGNFMIFASVGIFFSLAFLRKRKSK